MLLSVLGDVGNVDKVVDSLPFPTPWLRDGAMRTKIMDTQTAESGQCLMFQLFASVPVQNKNPPLGSVGAEGAFHLQSVS